MISSIVSNGIPSFSPLSLCTCTMSSSSKHLANSICIKIPLISLPFNVFTIIHLATPYLGFGGVGNSGMGSYHGKKSFDTFTHEKSIIKKSDKIDIPVRYMPYNKAKEQLMKFFLKL